jgi:transcriptional regulator with XRE-family HTH domain
MAQPFFKNYLRTYRKKLGLSQRQVAAIVGFKSSAKICDLELGVMMPTTRDCVAFGVLYKRSFRELWPMLNLEIEAEIDHRIRRLIGELEKDGSGPEDRRKRAKEISKRLQAIVDGLPEDLANVI